jgi:putative endonuclease
MDKQAFVYILASQKNGTLYTGVTSNLVQRIYEHKTKAHADSFTAKYNVNKLVWYTMGDDIASAIELEKKIKNRKRAWKIALIEKANPYWDDLSLDFMDSATNAQNDLRDGHDTDVTLHEVAGSSMNIPLDSAIALRFAQNDGGDDHTAHVTLHPIARPPAHVTLHAVAGRSINKLLGSATTLRFAQNDRGAR